MRRLLGVVTVAAVASGGIAAGCGDLGASSDRSPGATSDGGGFGSSGGTGDGGGRSAAPLVVVHAAYGVPALRLCLSGRMDRVPAPSVTTMPRSNLVGIDVGTAQQVDELTTAGPAPLGDAGGGGVDAGGGGDAGAPLDAGAAADGGKMQDASTDAAPPNVPVGRLFLVPEELVRFRTGASATCSSAVTALGSAAPIVELEAAAGVTLESPGTRVIVLYGCPAGLDAQTALASCDAPYDPARGNLKARLFSVPASPIGTAEIRAMSLSPSLSQAATAFEYGFLDSSLKPTDLLVPKERASLGAPVSVVLPRSLGGFASQGIIARGATPTLKQSLAELVDVSSTQKLPSEFYANVNGLMVVAVGSTKETAAERAPHFVVVPTSYEPPQPTVTADGSSSASAD